ncbi:exonuclease subunit SbcD [Bacillus idriensis]|uniref:Nuclease SbcCD subunit D n=1 Tax=Metabacillus idriensis TaxID=324768 RepID=A0A6I2M3H7_9BACI|nr:exonuclease SbcCD subunit D [Metabacillus idriensis]MRX52645.1 exonuclease subunit SbcD [Metabacillus idriensis]
MRILHTADWHLGRTLEGRSRLLEQAQFLDELSQIVIDEKADAVIMAGDAFDTVNPPAAAEQLFYESISRLSDKGRRPVIVIAGNHDNPERLQAASPLADTQGIHLIGYPSSGILTVDVPAADQSMMMAALAYPSEARLKEVLSDSHDEILLRNSYDERIRDLFAYMAEQFRDDTVNLAMSHIYVAGGSSTDSERPIEVGGAYTVAASSLPEKAQYVALGHLHRPQTLKRAGTMARYSGSPLAYSFSESGYAKSVSIVDIVPGGQAQVSEVLLSSGKPLVKWRAQEGLQQVHQWLDDGKDQNAWIDLEVHLKDTLSLEEIHRLRNSHPGFVHIRPVFEKSINDQSRESRANLPIDELFAKFYEQQTGGAQPDQETMKLFLDMIHDEPEEEEDKE